MAQAMVRGFMFLLSYLSYGLLNIYLIDRTLRYGIRRRKFVYPAALILGILLCIVNTVLYESGGSSAEISGSVLYFYIAVLCIMIFLALKEKWWKKILVIFLSTHLISCVNTMFYSAPSLVIPEERSDLSHPVILVLGLTFLFSVLEFLFFVLIAKMGDRHNDKPIPIPLLIIIVIVISTLSDIAIDGVLYTEEFSRKTIVTILMLICLAVMVVAVYISGANRERNDLRLLNRQNEEYLNAQTKHFERSAEADTEVRAMRHDMRNNVQVLMLLLEKGEYDKMRDYLEEMGDALSKADVSIHTGSSVADAIISEKMADASSKGIKLNCGGVISGVSFTPLDTCKMLANILDNAIEACEADAIRELPDRIIDLQFKRTDNHFMITCTNPSAYYVDLTSDEVETLKEDRKLHGFGVRNIKTAASEYKGEINSECVKTSYGYSFSLDIIFPVES
ncbi:MAG: GHKL domain-containing protein [Clostridiales bacterium]|nr:GHKL domain-containing protein [Clostridiales bacterium]